MKKVIIAVFLIFFVWKCGCSNKQEIKNSPLSSGQSAWYKGGTLHKSKVKDWKEATEKNKLATCGDFVAKFNREASLNQIKQYANNLKICINESVKDHEVVDNEDVSSIAAICLALLKN